jgi:phage terminase large subunit
MSSEVLTVDPATLSLEEKAFLSSFKGFVMNVLQLPYYRSKTRNVVGQCKGKDGKVYYDVTESDWQEQVFDAIDQHGSRTAVLTSNGAGKTSIILAGIILAHLALFENSKVVSTSGAWRQLKSQLWPALMAQSHKFPEWEFVASEFRIKAPNGSEYLGFSTNDEGKAEGYHGNKYEDYLAPAKGPLLIIVDEAKTVPLGVFQAFDRCTYQRLLYISSGGGAEGVFYDAMKPGSNFTKFKISASQCPHADHDKNAEMIEKWGLDHPLIRSTVFAEFMTSADNAVLDVRDIERAMKGTASKQLGRKTAALDFAAGGDENVLAVAEGNVVRIIAAWTEPDTVRAAARFITLLKENHIGPDDAYGDAEGLGTAVMDSMAALGWRIRRHRNGEAAKRDDVYLNAGAEMWGEAAAMLRKGELILPNDAELAAQLAGRKWKPGTPRLQLESKGDARSRGVGSPDRADACLMALYHRAPAVSKSLPSGWGDDDEGLTANHIPGAFAGAA